MWLLPRLHRNRRLNRTGWVEEITLLRGQRHPDGMRHRAALGQQGSLLGGKKAPRHQRAEMLRRHPLLHRGGIPQLLRTEMVQAPPPMLVLLRDGIIRSQQRLLHVKMANRLLAGVLPRIVSRRMVMRCQQRLVGVTRLPLITVRVLEWILAVVAVGGESLLRHNRKEPHQVVGTPSLRPGESLGETEELLQVVMRGLDGALLVGEARDEPEILVVIRVGASVRLTPVTARDHRLLDGVPLLL